MGVVKTAIIPVAGLGTRFLPATKAVPKELLPIVDKPTLQYILEEAFESGLERVVLVTARGKSAIEDHFDRSPALEGFLNARGKEDAVQRLRKISEMGEVISVRQHEPNGLGHAVLCGRPVVGDAPFAVLLGDDVIRTDPGTRPGIGQLMDAFAATDKGQIALMRVPGDEISKYGAAEGEVDPSDSSRFEISGLVEKPPPGTAKTDQAVIGRYVLPASIWPMLKETKPGRGGEIQLTDALEMLRAKEGLMGTCFSGRRVDAGDRVGYLTANLLEALSRDDMRDDVRTMMRELLAESE